MENQNLGLAVTVMAYVLYTQGWPVRPLFVNSKSGSVTLTPT
jgi:hypothetical protein